MEYLGPQGTFWSLLYVLGLFILVNLYELYTLWLENISYCFDFGSQFSWPVGDSLPLIFCVDRLALTLSTLVLILAMLAIYFGTDYAKEETYARRTLALLLAGPVIIILSFYWYDLLFLMVAWQSTSCIFTLLVNDRPTRTHTPEADLMTIVLAVISDVLMLMTFLLTIAVFNTTNLSSIFAQTPDMSSHTMSVGGLSLHSLTVISTLLTLAVCTKATQFFAHAWLLDASKVPASNAALIYFPIVLIGGTYLIFRFSIIFTFAPLTNGLLILFGGLALSFGSVAATSQKSTKELIAYVIISQIGYLMCGCGFGSNEKTLLYLVLLILSQALLFIFVRCATNPLNTNTNSHQTGEVDAYPLHVYVLLFLVCLSFVGLHGTAGFLWKEFFLLQAPLNPFILFFVWGCWLVSLISTPVYTSQLIFMVCFETRKWAFFFHLLALCAEYCYSTQLLRTLRSAQPKPGSIWEHTVSLYRELVHLFRNPTLLVRSVISSLIWLWSLTFVFEAALTFVVLVLIVFHWDLLDSLIPSGSSNLTQRSLVIYDNYVQHSLTNSEMFFRIECFVILSLISLFKLSHSPSPSSSHEKVVIFLELMTIGITLAFVPNWMLIPLMAFLIWDRYSRP